MPSSDESFVRQTQTIDFNAETLLDTHISDLKQKYKNLEKLDLTGCTFSGEATFEDLPVLENATTIKSITASGSTGLEPGANDGVPATWLAAVNIEAIDVSNNGWTAAQVDAFINALDAAVQAGLGGSAAACTLDISSNAVPTAASSAARSALAGYDPAWTLTVDS